MTFFTKVIIQFQPCSSTHCLVSLQNQVTKDLLNITKKSLVTFMCDSFILSSFLLLHIADRQCLNSL